MLLKEYNMKLLLNVPFFQQIDPQKRTLTSQASSHLQQNIGFTNFTKIITDLVIFFTMLTSQESN